MVQMKSQMKRLKSQSGRVPTQESCPHGTGVHMGAVANSEALWTRHLGGFVEFRYIGMINYTMGPWWLTGSQPAPVPRAAGVGLKVPSGQGSVFWWPTSILKLARAPTRVISLDGKMLIALGTFPGCQTLCASNWRQRPHSSLWYHDAVTPLFFPLFQGQPRKQ